MEFKIKIKEEELGPYSLQELKTRLAAGSLSPDTKVRPVKGGGEFVPLSDWVSPEDLKKEQAPAAKASPAVTGVKKLPARKLPKRPSAPKTTPRKLVKKKQGFKNRALAALGSVTFAILLVLVFLYFWDRTGVDFALPESGVELLKNGEPVAHENQSFRKGRMAPGEYEFEVRSQDAGLMDWTSTVSVSFGRLHRETIELEALTVVLHLESEESDATFRLVDANGEEIESGLLPTTLSSLALGAYTVTFIPDNNGEPEEKSIYLHPERVENVERISDTEYLLAWSLSEEPSPLEEDDIFAESEETPQEEEPDPGTAILIVNTKPEGVRVGVFGEDEFVWRGTTPATLRNLTPGEYEVEFRAEHRDIKRMDVYLEVDTSKTIEEDFSGGTVRVVTEPAGAFVRQGTRFLGRTPVTLENIQMGDIEIEVGFPGEDSLILEGTITDTPLILGARYSDGSWREQEAYYEN